jgi:hypothetical protein
MIATAQEVKSIEVQFQNNVNIQNASNMTLRVMGLLNLLEDRPHSTVISIKTYTKDSKSYGISSGSLTVVNRDILTPSPFLSL